MKTNVEEEVISDFEDDLKSRKRRMKKKKIKICFFCEKYFDVGSVEQTLRHNRCLDCYQAKIEKKMKYKNVVCNYCGKKFIDTYYTKRGVTETKTRTKKCPDCLNIKLSKGPLPKPKGDIVECDICGMTFTKKINIYNHMDKHRSDVSCRACGAKFTARSALRGHLRTHFEQFVCELCGFTTNSSATFRIHSRLHAGLPRYKRSYDRKELERGDFPCETCGIVFNTKVALLGHIKRQHSKNGVNGFSCRVCGHVTYRIKEYRIHAISHSSKPLLFCTYPGCSIFYDRLKKLNAHIRNVHKNSQTYSCEICNKSFKYKHSVLKHMRNKRCVPLSQRKLGLDSLCRTAKNKSVEELEEISRMAKEQYLEVRGSITVIEGEKLVEDEMNDIKQEEVHLEENIINVFEDENPVENECNVLDDLVELQLIPEPTQDVKEIKIESDPIVKVEIKTEPIDFEDLGDVISQDDWHFLNDDIYNLKNISECSNIKMELDLDPVVVLERLDPKIIKSYTRKEINKKLFEVEEYYKKIVKQQKLLANIKKFGSERRVKNLKYECDFCGKRYISKKALIRHHPRHALILKHPCDHCTESFSRSTYLREHQRSIHNIREVDYASKDFICDLCGKGYITFALLKSHMNLVHFLVANLQCAYCPRMFKTKAYLNRHESDVHEQILRYPCQYCGKFFKRKHQLKIHELTHSSPMEACKICGKMVKVMKHHMRFVHGNNRKPVELFPCPTCGKSFTKCNLAMHIERVHMKSIYYRTKMRYCTHCNESFTRVDDLRRHDILMHFPGIPKKCPYENCDAIFKKTKPLNVHIRNRHKRKEHFCNVCGKKFKSRSGVLKHTKIKGHRIEEKDLEAVVI